MNPRQLSEMEKSVLSDLRKHHYFPNWSLFLSQIKKEAKHRDAFATLILSRGVGDKVYGTVYPFNADTVVNIVPTYWNILPIGTTTLRAVVNVGSDHLGLYWSEFVLITRKGAFLRTNILPKGELAQEIFLVKYLPLLENTKHENRRCNH